MRTLIYEAYEPMAVAELRKVAADKSLDDRGRIDAARRILFGELPGEATK